MVLTTRLLLLMVACVHSSWAASFWGSLKLDCGVSVWSEWTPNQDGVSRTRTRQVYRQPQHGGALCPTLSETEIDPWNPNRTVSDVAQTVRSALLSPRVITDSASSRRRRQATGPTILPRDILFIVDMSGSVTLENYEMVKANIAALVEKICGDVGPDVAQNRVAVVTFSTNVFINFHFLTYSTLQEVQDAIISMYYEGFSTCLDKALLKSQQVFNTNNGMRGDAFSVKEVVILTDGEWNCGVTDNDIYNLVHQLTVLPQGRPIAVYAFVIGVSSLTTQVKIDKLVSYPVQNHLFTVADMGTFNKTVAFILTYGGNDNLCAPLII